ncbi:MAG: hypothetical protein ACRC7N_05550 [Clostridium sp.]
MGIDAYVQCNCIKEGKVKPPPFDIELIEVLDGIYDIKEEVSDEIYHLYRKWSNTACNHQNFNYYQNRIGNVSGASGLWGIIEKVGEENVPEVCNLFKYWKLSPHKAEEALKELELLKKALNSIYGIFLLEVGTDKGFGDIIDTQRRWFYSHGGAYYYGLCKEGFYVEDDTNKEVFKSIKFTQKVDVIKNENKEIYKVTFTDVATGKTYLSGNPIKSMDWYTKLAYFPKELYVHRRTLTSEDIISIVVLEELFKASIKMKNPVVIK